ncbi:MAG: response regulator [Rhodothermus sp.]|nr:response regulator [Rhodothermus sp.]
MRTKPLDILLVEDDEEDYHIVRRLLSRATTIQCTLHWRASYEDGLAALRMQPFDVCLVDYRLGAHDGLSLLRTIRSEGITLPIILLTGQGDLQVDLEAMAAGAWDYLIKGQIDTPQLERTIRYAVERHRAEERIREQAALLDAARDVIMAVDLEGRITYWNRSAEQLTGKKATAVQGRPVWEVLDGLDRALLQEAFRAVQAEGVWHGTLRLHKHDGEERLLESRCTLVRDAYGQPRSVLMISTDVTERRQLEQQFLRAQRMESIGRLVSGMAHDLNNLFVPILLGVRMLSQDTLDPERRARALGMIQRSAERGADLVRQVLAFARGMEGERALLDVRTIVQEVAHLLQETFPSTIRIETQVDEALWSVQGDATQLQQVLMNLCVNARDAMPEGGHLLLAAENVRVDEPYARRVLEARPGPYVRLTVSDTGTGIPHDILDKIFEPFFTTKPVGKGSGLGLSTVYSIVRSHGGFINVYSEPGQGTTFRVYLPAAPEVEATVAKAETPTYRGAGEGILLVDDEPFVLESAREVLEQLGYRVYPATQGQEALDQLEAHAADIRAVITDLVMPEMDGLALIRAIRERWPELPVVASSGLHGGRAEAARQAGAHAFLHKPYTAEKLAAVLHQVLRSQRR